MPELIRLAFPFLKSFSLALLPGKASAWAGPAVTEIEINHCAALREHHPAGQLPAIPPSPQKVSKGIAVE